MKYYVLLIVATFTATARIMIYKKIGHDSKDKKRMFLFNGIIFAVAAGVIFASLLGNLKSIGEISLFSFLLAIVFASSILLTQLTEIVAMGVGSVSMTMMVFSCGFLIPTFYGCIFLGETISVFQYIGLAVLVGALFLIISPEKNERLSVVWLVFTALSTLGSGINAVIQKIHQASEHSGEFLPFLLYTMIFSAAFSFIAFFLTRGGASEEKTERSGGLVASFLVLGGVAVGVINILNLVLAGKLPAVIQFPIYNIGSMILSGLGGRFLFGERLSGKKLAGFITGCVAISIISLL